jgi:tagaturonate epimerase
MTATGTDPLSARADDLARDPLPASRRRAGDLVAWLEADPARPGHRRLAALAAAGDAALAAFAGDRHDAGDGHTLLHAPTSAANAAALRAAFPDLAPRPLGLATSAGFGDRLGVATPGHVRALRSADPDGRIRPIFAQQSIREMTRTGRSAQEVVDDAGWGAFASGWTDGVGADADHLKTEAHVRTCLDAGFSFFTFDPGDHVDDAATEATAPRAAGEGRRAPLGRSADPTTGPAVRGRYLGRESSTPTAWTLRFDDETLARAAAKYGAALAGAAHLHRVLATTGGAVRGRGLRRRDRAPPPRSRSTPSSPSSCGGSGAPGGVAGAALRGTLREGRRLPRRPGRAGPHPRRPRPHRPRLRTVQALAPQRQRQVQRLRAIAEATARLVHLKTAGTSYLEALRVAADRSTRPLFREVLAWRSNASTPTARAT